MRVAASVTSSTEHGWLLGAAVHWRGGGSIVSRLVLGGEVQGASEVDGKGDQLPVRGRTDVGDEADSLTVILPTSFIWCEDASLLMEQSYGHSESTDLGITVCLAQPGADADLPILVHSDAGAVRRLHVVRYVIDETPDPAHARTTYGSLSQWITEEEFWTPAPDGALLYGRTEPVDE